MATNTNHESPVSKALSGHIIGKFDQVNYFQCQRGYLTAGDFRLKQRRGV
jgi:hypothetical protein